jgi:hypothetical protein
MADNAMGRVYLAGPFTSKTDRDAAGAADATDSVDATGSADVMDVISRRSAWRWALLAAEETLCRAGWSVFLPHRDVSEWGARRITPGDVVRECLSAVKESDVVVALLEESFGTHVEVGVALGMGIPVVVVRCQDQAQSYFGGGIGPASLAGELVIPTVRGLADGLGGSAFERALADARTGAALVGSVAG